MNLFTEIDALPRQSRVALIAHMLKGTRPSPKEISDAAGVSRSVVDMWIRWQRPFPAKGSTTPTESTL